MIAILAHDDAPLAVDQNAVRTVELPLSTALAADGSHVAAVAVAQHLHAMITHVSCDDVACTVKRDAAGFVKLTSACSFAAYGAGASAVAESNNLQAMIHFVGDNNVALEVPCRQRRVFEQPVG